MVAPLALTRGSMGIIRRGQADLSHGGGVVIKNDLCASHARQQQHNILGPTMHVLQPQIPLKTLNNSHRASLCLVVFPFGKLCR